MSTFLKWAFLPILAVVVVGYILFSSSVQNISTRTLAETEATMATVGVGAVRTNLNEKGQLDTDIRELDKEELVENLLSEIASVQKNLTYTLKVDYVFVDGKGKATKKDEDIRGIQYRVQYLDDKGEVKGTAERHLTLHQLKE